MPQRAQDRAWDDQGKIPYWTPGEYHKPQIFSFKCEGTHNCHACHTTVRGRNGLVSDSGRTKSMQSCERPELYYRHQVHRRAVHGPAYAV